MTSRPAAEPRLWMISTEVSLAISSTQAMCSSHSAGMPVTCRCDPDTSFLYVCHDCTFAMAGKQSMCKCKLEHECDAYSESQEGRCPQVICMTSDTLMMFLCMASGTDPRRYSTGVACHSLRPTQRINLGMMLMHRGHYLGCRTSGAQKIQSLSKSQTAASATPTHQTLAAQTYRTSIWVTQLFRNWLIQMMV